jgi:NAD(P)-dependent dehydrogenase (short-subunit alcohol dehydrogenase family)
MTDHERQQDPPGTTGAMRDRPDHGEDSYHGSGRLADVAIAYLNEHEDARETAAYVEKAGRQAILIPGDLTDRDHCREVVEQTVQQLGGLEILVNNAAFQMTHETLEEIPDEEWQHTFDLNITAMFRLVQIALPHLGAGASIINTSSINYSQPRPTLLPYATTKGAIANFTAGLAQMLGERGIRANAVAPGPIWTPLIPSTMPPSQVESFGKDTPLGRPGQPKELAPVYVMLASDEASYISGAVIPVTGGKPIL